MYIVRKALYNEYHKYREHLKALDAASKYLRFGYPISDEMIDRLCNGIEANPKMHKLFCIEDNDLEFIGVGHIALEGGMELAFSVLNKYQGSGMGNSLMKRCIQWCRTHDILKGHMVCLSHNKAIRHLCTKNGIHIHSVDGETMGDIVLDSPTIITFFNEAADKNIGMFDYMTKRTRLTW
jgi:RimJ/RimL family protein N-acetyltransferase